MAFDEAAYMALSERRDSRLPTPHSRHDNDNGEKRKMENPQKDDDEGKMKILCFSP